MVGVVRVVWAALVAACLTLGAASAQTTALVALTPTPVQRFVDNNGNALAGGQVFTYAAGTNTKLATYTDSTGATPNTNPIILNSRGEANIWLSPILAYKFVLSPSTDSDPPTNPIWTVDNVSNPPGGLVYNPYSYGSIGASDDQPAIQAAVVAAEASNSVFGVGCVILPAKQTPYVLLEPLHLSLNGCIKGQGMFSTTLSFPNHTDGITTSESFQQIKDLNILGSADTDTGSTNTHGVQLGSIETTFNNVYIQDFGSCVQFLAPNVRHVLNNVNCNEQNYYPNLNNHFPYAGLEFAIGTSPRSNQAIEMVFGELRGQANIEKQLYSGNGSTTFFDLTLPIGDHLWSAMGITTSVAGTVKTCGNAADYKIWDITASGGGGSGGVQLTCGVITAGLTSGSAVATVSASTAGITTGQATELRAYQGIPLATSVVSVASGTSITMSNPATWTGSVQLWYYSIAVGGANRLATCYTTNTCGETIEVRYASAPGAGTNNVQVAYIDPTMYADVDAENANDVRITPTISSGAIYGLYQPTVDGSGRGNIAYEPAYIEIQWLPETFFGVVGGDEIKIPDDIANDVGSSLIGGEIPGYYDSANCTPSSIRYLTQLNFVCGMAPAINGVAITAP